MTELRCACARLLAETTMRGKPPGESDWRSPQVPGIMVTDATSLCDHCSRRVGAARTTDHDRSVGDQRPGAKFGRENEMGTRRKVADILTKEMTMTKSSRIA